MLTWVTKEVIILLTEYKRVANIKDNLLCVNAASKDQNQSFGWWVINRKTTKKIIIIINININRNININININK